MDKEDRLPDNELYYGDNLDILRRCIADESVDLIYLDPPFNSKRVYNVIFHDKTGREPASQIEAFNDTWSWGETAQDAYDDLMRSPAAPASLKETMRAFKSFLDETDLMAYLAMMAIRLVEMHRVLKPTGALYLHCDPTASHYLKIVLDHVFGKRSFRNEIIWHYRRWTASSKRFQRMHDVLLFYSHSDDHSINQIEVLPTEGQLRKHKRGWDRNTVPIDGVRKPQLIIYDQDKVDAAVNDGRLKLNEFARIVEPKTEMTIAPDVWIIDYLNSQAKERLGYPTQKPLALLERIIKASSNSGDMVLDPFCGCGTAVVAAEKLGRRWIGIDITYLAVGKIKERLAGEFPQAKYREFGIPRSIADARILFQQSPIEFQKWAVSLVGGQSRASRGGGDRGVDGVLFFRDFDHKYHKIIIEVKGGGYQPKDVRALKAVMDRDGAPLGLMIVLEEPTKGMLTESAALGKWKLPGGAADYPVLQILSIEDYFSGRLPRLPDTSVTHRSAGLQLAEREITTSINWAD